MPRPFPKTDSKLFRGTLFDPPRVDHLAQTAGIDLGAFGYAAGDIDPEQFREVWGEQADAMIAEAKHHNELAWHTPAEFIRSLEGLAREVGTGDRAGWYADRCHFVRYYFETGLFLSDVLGCLAAIRWADEQGARRVRFYAF